MFKARLASKRERAAATLMREGGGLRTMLYYLIVSPFALISLLQA